MRSTAILWCIILPLVAACDQQAKKQERVIDPARKSAIEAAARSPGAAILVGTVIHRQEFKVGFQEYVIDVREALKRIHNAGSGDEPGWSFVPNRFIQWDKTEPHLEVGGDYLVVCHDVGLLTSLGYVERLETVSRGEIEEIESLLKKAGGSRPQQGSPSWRRSPRRYELLGIVKIEEPSHAEPAEARLSKPDWVPEPNEHLLVVYPYAYHRRRVVVFKVLRVLNPGSFADEIEVIRSQEQRRSLHEGACPYLVKIRAAENGTYTLVDSVPVWGSREPTVRRVEKWLKETNALRRDSEESK